MPLTIPPMTTNQLIADTLAGNLSMLKQTLADFTDAEMLVRPVPGANHPAWQIGHLAVAEASLVNAVAPGAVPPPSEAFAAKFSKDASKIDDPAAFPGKAELLAEFERVRAATVAWVNTLKPEDLDRPTPAQFRGWVPNVGMMALMQEGHLTMHIGQLQVARRKLGKPVLF